MSNRDYKNKLRLLSQVEPRAATWLNQRQKLVDYLQTNPQLTEVASYPRPKFYFRPVYIAAVCLVLVLVGATSTFAQASLPGEPLYPLKKAMEKIEVALATTKQAKTQKQMVLTDRRLTEAEKLLDQDKMGEANEALQGYQEQMVEMQNQLTAPDGDNSAWLRAGHQALTKQQERLAQMAGRSVKFNLDKQSQLEDKLIKVMDETGNKELDLVDKISADAKIINRKDIKAKEQIIESELGEVSGGKALAPVIKRAGWSVDDIQKKIADSTNLLQQLEAKLATITDLSQQEKLLKLYDKIDQQLQLAQDGLNQLNGFGDDSYKEVYRQAIKAYQLVLELQVRLNSAARSNWRETNDIKDNQIKLDKSRDGEPDGQSDYSEDN